MAVAILPAPMKPSFMREGFAVPRPGGKHHFDAGNGRVSVVGWERYGCIEYRRRPACPHRAPTWPKTSCASNASATP